jgi:hypothetical protein
MLWVVTVMNMSEQRAFVAYTVAALLTVIGASSVSADKSVSSPSSSTTVIEQFDAESGILWTLIDEQTIEVNLPD